MKPSTWILISCVVLAGCATNPDDLNTEDLWRDYCATDAHRTEEGTRVTVQSWDPDHTTAGHRGVATDPVLEPDGTQPPPRGC